MFSSSFSLRQNIKAVDTELGDYKVSNNARVDVLETFKANLEGDAAGSIADLETKHNEQAALIETLETNATALKSRIDTFNAALEDGSDGTISTIEQIKLNKDGLAQEITDRASEITRVEGLLSTETAARVSDTTYNETLIITETSRATAAEAVLQTNINAEATARSTAIATEVSNRTAAVNAALGLIGDEETRAIAAEAGLQTNIAAEAAARAAAITTEATSRAAAIALEVVNRNNAIAVEAAARAAAITAEQTTRETAIEKLGFMPFCEAEGILIDNSYPFCLGMGSPSDVGFGMPVPFSYTLRGIAWSIHSSDTDPSISIELTHYPSDGSASMVLFSGIFSFEGKSGEYQNIEVPTYSPGNMVVKLLSSSGITDDNTRYRLSFVLTFNDSIYYSSNKK